MNIRDPGMWPDSNSIPALSVVSWGDLLKQRGVTFRGFAELEKEKGLLSLPVSFGTPRGQDLGRLFMARAIEEFCEAVQAKDQDHVLEELIDSFNYLTCLPHLDPDLGKQPTMLPKTTAFHDLLRGFKTAPTTIHLGTFTYNLMLATDTFRNRAWMHNAQSLYFDGYKALGNAIDTCILLILQFFPDWQTFWCMWKAKDNVLQFRLRTRY